MHPRSKTVVLLKAHDQRTPGIRVDAIGGRRHPDVVMHMNPHDPHLQDEYLPALGVIVGSQ